MCENLKNSDNAAHDALKKAVEYGVDIEMLKANLNRTVMERFTRHQSALELVRFFQKAVKI